MAECQLVEFGQRFEQGGAEGKGEQGVGSEYKHVEAKKEVVIEEQLRSN